MDHPAVAVVGPTGSGKSRLGLHLAARFAGEIVSCDALQVYRGMDIGTAKASAQERALVPHHMLDLKEPWEEFSAGDYLRAGRTTLREIRGRGHIPFVVGGSGFYLRALVEGLFEGPGRSEELRSRLKRIVEQGGVRRLHQILRRADPAAARRIMETDGSRIVRAYEVYRVTGKPMSWWQDQPRDALGGFRWLKLGLEWPREELYRQIDSRVMEMTQKGLIEEVQGLRLRYPKDSQALKAIGYRQISDYLDGSRTLEQAIADTQMESRRYAKRQLTWFRRDPAIEWLDGSLEFEEISNRALRKVEEFLSRE